MLREKRPCWRQLASCSDSNRRGQVPWLMRCDSAESGFGLDGHWNKHHLQVKYAESLKSFAVDSKPQSRSADYLIIARVSWISTDDIQLVRGSGNHRRRYLDFLGAQVVPNYLRNLRVYERALRSRNALLKENRPSREIEAFDTPLAEAGTMLMLSRTELCHQLRSGVTATLHFISGGSEALEIAYQAGSPSTSPMRFARAAKRKSGSKQQLSALIGMISPSRWMDALPRSSPRRVSNALLPLL